MLTLENMRRLKRVNISKDAEKTKERIEVDFKSTSRVNKNTIINLSGLKRHTFYRVFVTGAATPRVVLSMAQTLNVSPYYYIGVEDEKGECNDEIIIRFLQEHGYENLVKEIRENDKSKTLNNSLDSNLNDGELIISSETYNGAFKESNEAYNDKITLSITLDNSQKMRDAITRLDEESAVILLKALIKRADVNENVETLYGLVKRCLLS